MSVLFVGWVCLVSGCAGELGTREKPEVPEVDPPEAVVELVEAELPPAVAGADYEHPLVIRGGGTGAYRWSLEAPALPWIGIDTGGRLFSVSVPTDVTNDEGEAVTVTVTDTTNRPTVFAFRLRVDCVDGTRVRCFSTSAVTLSCMQGESVCVAGRPSGGCEDPAFMAPSNTVEKCGENCGQCDGAVANACRDGDCVCGDGPSCAQGLGSLEQCCASGDAAHCVSLMDGANCGECGNDCSTQIGARKNVVAGCDANSLQCDFKCAPGFANCFSPNGTTDGSAPLGCHQNLATDTDHCGACGVSCKFTVETPNAVAACREGACGLTCAPGFSDCDGVFENGCEVQLASSFANCGACGNSCRSGERCSSGACVPAVTCGPKGCTGIKYPKPKLGV